MKITVIVATYGDQSWADLARSRALPSTDGQGADEVIVKHEPDGNVASCRNTAAVESSGDLLIYLDADDELAPGYVAAIRVAAVTAPTMLTPRVQYVNRGREQAPKFWPEKPLSEGNWMVIGTAVPRDLFLEVGGFDARPHAYEDWAGFAKLWKEGCEIVKVPDAVYRAHVMPDSRNKKLSRAERVQIHYDIGRELFPAEYPPSWLDVHLRNARSRV